MFKLKPAITFAYPVDIPRADGDDASLNFIFRHKTRDEFRDFLNRAGEAKQDDIDPLLEIIEGWKDVDGEFSPQALRQLVQDFHGAPAAILSGYVAALTEGRRGN